MADYGYPYGVGYSGRLARKTGSLIAPELSKYGGRSWKVVTQPTTEPVTVNECKTFSRIDTDEEDTLIESFILSARMAAEEYMGRALIRQTIRTIMDFWPDDVVELPRPPLISVDKVAALDEDDTETEYDSDNYYLITEATPGKLVIKRDVTWPTNTSRDYGRFVIESKHGYGTDAGDVPEPIREGIKLWVGVIYATREFDPKKPPPEAKGKFDLYKTVAVMIR